MTLLIQQPDFAIYYHLANGRHMELLNTAPNAYRESACWTVPSPYSTLSFELDRGPLRESPNLLKRPPSLQIDLVIESLSTVVKHQAGQGERALASV